MKLAWSLAPALLFATVLAAEPVHTKSAEPLRIAHGAEVSLADYLVPGKTTVFDFTSQYCPPCRGYEEPLHQLHAKRADLAIVKVDINRADVQRIDWQSPVAKQFNLHSIPAFKVYSPEGKLVAEDTVVFGPDGRPAEHNAAARKLVDAWIAESVH